MDRVSVVNRAQIDFFWAYLRFDGLDKQAERAGVRMEARRVKTTASRQA